MPYEKGTRLPGESASKLGHLRVIQSEWVQELIKEFEYTTSTPTDSSNTRWTAFDPLSAAPLPRVFAVDGSYATVSSTDYPRKQVSFIKTALIRVDKTKLDKIDKENPHPLLLQDAMSDSALYHATVLPLVNIKSKLGSNYDAVRHIIHDSMKVDQSGAYYETLKWLAYSKWSTSPKNSPSFDCPHCEELVPGLPFDTDEGQCPNPKCKKPIFLSDMIGFHLDMVGDSARESVSTAYMLVMETLMLLTAIRFYWDSSDKSVVSNTLFIKDGPLALSSQYSKLVPSIRDFLEHSRACNRPIHVIGQEKTGAFAEHLASIVRFASPQTQDDLPTYSVLSHRYVQQEVHRSGNRKNPYGMRTNWGEKVYLKIDPGTGMVLNVPTGNYNSEDESFPEVKDLIGFNRILATVPTLVSHKFEGALFPVELANGVASMSSYPSARVLQLFAGF
jgi:hypothetical protein